MNHGFPDIAIMIVGFVIHDKKAFAVDQGRQHKHHILPHHHGWIAVFLILLNQRSSDQLHASGYGDIAPLPSQKVGNHLFPHIPFQIFSGRKLLPDSLSPLLSLDHVIAGYDLPLLSGQMRRHLLNHGKIHPVVAVRKTQVLSAAL